jgi:hypothetical protein
VRAALRHLARSSVLGGWVRVRGFDGDLNWLCDVCSVMQAEPKRVKMSTDLSSFVDVSPDSHFSIHNIPFGVFRVGDTPARVGTAIGDNVRVSPPLSLAGRVCVCPAPMSLALASRVHARL